MNWKWAFKVQVTRWSQLFCWPRAQWRELANRAKRLAGRVLHPRRPRGGDQPELSHVRLGRKEPRLLLLYFHPNLWRLCWSETFYLLPFGWSTLPHRCREGWSSNIGSPVIQQCRAYAGPGQQGLFLNLSANWRKCSGVTWNRTRKQTTKPNQPKEDLNSLNSLKTVKISSIWCLNIKRRDFWSFNANSSESV